MNTNYIEYARVDTNLHFRFLPLLSFCEMPRTDVRALRRGWDEADEHGGVVAAGVGDGRASAREFTSSAHFPPSLSLLSLRQLDLTRARTESIASD